MTTTSHLLVTPWQPAGRVEEFTCVGYACALMTASRAHASHIAEHLGAVIQPAIVHRQLTVYFNDDDAPVGYVAWARFTPGVLAELRADRTRIPHLSEWNEGDRLSLVDVVAPYGNLAHMLRHFSRLGDWAELPIRGYDSKELR